MGFDRSIDKQQQSEQYDTNNRPDSTADNKSNLTGKQIKEIQDSLDGTKVDTAVKKFINKKGKAVTPKPTKINATINCTIKTEP